MKIFWSWQSDTDQATGRYFVRDVLRAIVTELKEADGTDDADRPDDAGALPASEIAVDSDTSGVSGSPPIAETILEKIVKAGVFVADVTPIAITSGGKKVPNPNVAIELGYALRALGHKRIILVMNEAHGAELAALPFDLRHWRQPIAFDVGANAAKESKADAAAKLKARLKPAVRAALQFAIRETKEQSRMTNREPQLLVRHQDGDLGPLQIRQKVEKLTVKSLEEIKAETPLLPVPKTGISVSRLGPSTSSTMGILRGVSHTRSVEQWSPDEIEGYNASVKAYYKRYQDHLDALEEFELLKQRSFSVTLALANEGTARATDIDAVVTFPPIVDIYELDKFPERPAPPTPPPLKPLNSAFAYISRTPSPLINSPVLSGQFSNTRVRSADRRVEVSEEALKHHGAVRLDEFIVSFRNAADIASFEADYVITANEPVDPIRDTIPFVIEAV